MPPAADPAAWVHLLGGYGGHTTTLHIILSTNTSNLRTESSSASPRAPLVRIHDLIVAPHRDGCKDESAKQ